MLIAKNAWVFETMNILTITYVIKNGEIEIHSFPILRFETGLFPVCVAKDVEDNCNMFFYLDGTDLDPIATCYGRKNGAEIYFTMITHLSAESTQFNKIKEKIKGWCEKNKNNEAFLSKLKVYYSE